MKIELNPNSMTISELNDCIAEFTAERDRLQELERKKILEQCHDAVIDMMGTIWKFTERDENPWEVILSIKAAASGRTHCLKMNMASIEEWNIEVVKPAQ